MNKKLYCFPDTNLFIQCQPLEALDWSALGDFDVIDLIITRPVQKELDAHKGKGNARVASRSRAAASVLKEVFAAELGYKEVRSHSPCVRLYVQPDHKPDLELADVLNYGEVDDQLVGVISGFLKTNPNHRVRLVTDDVGPMASAKMANVPFTPIPDTWLLPPEEDTSSKELKRLAQELERYKKAEPEISLRWLEHGTSVERINVTVPCYEPLASHEVAELMQRIQLRFPLVENFDDAESQQRNALPSEAAQAVFDESLRRTSFYREFLGHEVYVPATAKQISQYQEAYAKWLQDCEGFLKNLHDHLAQSTPWPRLVIELQNSGTRSANDALVTITARGAFSIQPLKKADLNEEAIEPLRLPSPPKVPKGEWRDRFLQYALTLMPADINISPHPFAVPRMPSPREADFFYYKESRPASPVKQYSLECSLWRHQSDAELFELTLHPKLTPAEISGVVEINVLATNLSSAFTQRLPVKVNVQQHDLLERANVLVSDLIYG
ncbi:PIN domain-containing protein [Limnohabitans sp.]|uniref:PIN domain-containing protein n=1 Tax=Limnohabitans sp. TaxID=1907725 RepID=UPI00286F64B2|nr:PIN domain-containing protein [Limnohabitans sp.]